MRGVREYAVDTSAGEIVQVAIVGAGIAGLTAARDLDRAGCNSFVVLEARDRVGGRTVNHDLGDGYVAEGGGQWIGPGQTAVSDLARELGLATFETYYEGKTVILDGNMRDEADASLSAAAGSSPAVTHLNQLASGVPSGSPWEAKGAAALDKVTLAEWLAEQEIGPEEAFSLGRSTLLSYGAPPESLSLLYYLSVVNSSDCSVQRLESIKGGAQESRLVGGSQALSLKMAEALGSKVQLSSPVRKAVGWDTDTVELHTDRGVVRARQVIMALNPALCDNIQFDPPLPPGRAELQRQWPRNGRIRKVALVYPRPFWREAGFNGQVLQVDGPILWSCDNSPPDGSIGALLVFVRPDDVPQDEKRAEQLLSTIMAQALGDEALHPTQFHDVDWSTVDDWSLTCTMPLPPGLATSLGRYLRPAVGRLIWSGTETAEIWASAMDGAVRSGHAAALQSLAALSRA